jgi:hypothetical protein
MASKKRDGGGSNLGLIVTLVFFVLTTIILGVTTYMGFSELEAKEKAKVDAEQKLAERDKERNWWRFTSHVLQTYIGEGRPVGTTPAELAALKKQLDENTLTFAGEGKAEFTAMVKEFDKTMRWVNSEAPVSTFKSLLAKKDTDYAALGKQLQDAQDQIASEKERADKERAAALAAKKTFDAQIQKLTEDSKKSIADISTTTDAQRADLEAANQAKNKALADLATVQAELEKVRRSEASLKGNLATIQRTATELRDKNRDLEGQVEVLKDRTGMDRAAIEARRLDDNAVAALNNWRKNWEITDIDRFGRNYYINIGSADGLRPQITFSVHELGKDGKLNPVPKATIEVVEVRGPKLAQARVTSIRDAAANPILKGDRLFNATWDPTRKKHIALAGLVDMNNDRTDTTREFLRMLKNQNVEVDAMIDTRGTEPKLVGQITPRTDFVVIGDSLDYVNHPMLKTASARQAFDKLQREMREKATANAVPVLSLQRYMDMIGYTPPAISRPSR